MQLLPTDPACLHRPSPAPPRFQEPAVSDRLVFYTHPMSRGRMVRWMLEECRASYDTVVLDYQGGMKTPEFLALNPMGKVPTLQHGPLVVTETAAILCYLADLHAEEKLAPPVNDARRGSYYRWLFFVAGPMEAAVTGKALGLLAPPDKAGMVGYGSHDDVMRTLATLLEQLRQQGPFVCGQDFSAADLYLASQLHWGMQFGTVARRGLFEDYVQLCTDRPAYARAAALDEAELAHLRGVHDPI